MSKFKVGDKVRVVDSGHAYTTYVDFITSVLPEKIKLWQKGRRIKNGDYKVLASHIHTTMPEDGMLYIVGNLEGTEVYIIGERGLELIEPALPRICYILGGEDTPLEIGEEFGVEGDDNVYRISEQRYREVKITNSCWSSSTHEYGLTALLNNPEKIIRKPKIEFSDDEKAMMREFVKAGTPWIARDKDSELLYTYLEKPVCEENGMFDGVHGTESYHVPDGLLPQITFENSPINMEDYI